MSLFTAVEMAPRDPILGLNEQFNADTNPNKVNLGVGVYFDDNGKLPLLQCVQQAEAALMAKPTARGYLPIDGLAAYDNGVKALVFGADSEPVKNGRVATVQAIKGIAQVFGTTLIAEGIETTADLQAMRELEIPYGQGWLLGRPARHTQRATSCNDGQAALQLEALAA